jgi:DNA polymerase-1
MTKILIDGHSLAHRAKHTVGELTSETMHTGVIFGFFNQVLRLAKDYETHDIVFTWDSEKSHRIKIFPAYKESRRTLKENKTPEEIELDKATYKQIDLLHDEVLPLFGAVNNYKISGYEGDDLVASVVYANPDDDFIIATGDEDMYQLLCEGVSIRKQRVDHNGKKTYYLYTAEMFEKEYGITPIQWIQVKAIAGCHSDEIPGVKGVGETTALKYLNCKLTPNLKGYQAIVCPEGQQIRARNLKLVTLPLKDCPEIHLKEQGSFSFDGFIQICQQFDFQYFLRKDELTKWKKIMNLK